MSHATIFRNKKKKARLAKGLHNHNALEKDLREMTVKTLNENIAFFWHKSDILHYLIYHQENLASS